MYSEKIKEIRKTLDLSRSKLSNKINIAERTITSYEEGREPSLKFLAQLCKTFNVNANWFIYDYGEMFNPQPFEQVEDKLTQIVDERLKKYGLI